MIIRKKIGRETKFAGWGKFFHFLGVKNESGENNYVGLSLPFNVDDIHISESEARELRDALNEFLDA